MIALVNIRLNRKQCVRIADMFRQILRHFGDIFDQSRIDFSDSIGNRFIGNLIKVHGSVVRIYYHFDRVADIVDRCGLIQLIRFGVRVVTAGGVGVDDPIEFTAVGYHDVRVGIVI